MKIRDKELAKRALAQNDLYSFVKLKWERYNNAPFMRSWHIKYLCKVLESTIPAEKLLKNKIKSRVLSQKTLDSIKKAQNLSQISPHSNSQSHAQTHERSSQIAKKQSSAQSNIKPSTKENHNAEVSFDDFTRFEATSARSYLSGSDEAQGAKSRKSAKETTREAQQELITRLMLNMPPSYGKTEIIARCFIAWALGQDRKRKFFYISYSDDLCRKIANQVRDLLKSPFWQSIFRYPPEFLQDNAQEFVLREGGGLFVTTLKSALTGFHADQIIIDDPIKVSEMGSKSAIKAVNANFKESVLSRLQNNQSNITLLMQRLSQNDLCGFLLDEKEFDKDIIAQWKHIKLRALESSPKTYKIADFAYERAANEPLFASRHTKDELETLRLQMGNDEFSAQYLQEPLVTSGGYFDESYYTSVFLHEIGECNTYIFVDNALSLKESADNRAIVVIGAENYKDSVRYVLLDCFYGIWSEEETINHIIEAKSAYKSAGIYIESEGGGLMLHRLLLVEFARFNQKLKENGKEMLEDNIFCYTPSRKISKVDKIKAIRPFYNSGFLVFSHNARGQEQFKKELFSFNPDKPFKKDDCIDALASGITHEEVKPPPKQEVAQLQMPRRHIRQSRATWRI